MGPVSLSPTEESLDTCFRRNLIQRLRETDFSPDEALAHLLSELTREPTAAAAPERGWALLYFLSRLPPDRVRNVILFITQQAYISSDAEYLLDLALSLAWRCKNAGTLEELRAWAEPAHIRASLLPDAWGQARKLGFERCELPEIPEILANWRARPEPATLLETTRRPAAALPTHVPREILQKIFSYCDDATFFGTQIVSKTWHQAGAGLPRMWRRLIAKRWPDSRSAAPSRAVFVARLRRERKLVPSLGSSMTRARPKLSFCRRCERGFLRPSARDAHLRKNACLGPPPS